MTDPAIFAMVCEQRDSAVRENIALRRENASHLEALDALTRQAQDAADGVLRRQLDEALQVLAMVADTLRSVTPSNEERRVHNAMWALLAEHGIAPPEQVAMRQAAQAWLERRGQ